MKKCGSLLDFIQPTQSQNIYTYRIKYIHAPPLIFGQIGRKLCIDWTLLVAINKLLAQFWLDIFLRVFAELDCFSYSKTSFGVCLGSNVQLCPSFNYLAVDLM